MLSWYVRIAATVLLLAGLAGVNLGRVPGFAELTLFQSFLYLVLGAVGLKLGSGPTAPAALARYARFTGGFGLVLLGAGLTLPNFLDLVHLEVPEHVFHSLLGLTGSLVGERNLKTKASPGMVRTSGS